MPGLALPSGMASFLPTSMPLAAAGGKKPNSPGISLVFFFKYILPRLEVDVEFLNFMVKR